MPGDVPHGSDGRPLPPAFTQRTSRGPEPAAGERPLMPPYFATDRAGFGSAAAPARPAPAQATVASGTAEVDPGDEPWAATPDYEDAVGAAAAPIEAEALPIDEFLAPVPEPEEIAADDLVEVYDPVQALVRSVQLVEDAEQADAEAIDAETLDYVEAVALGEVAPQAPTTSADTESAADVGVPPEVMAALFSTPEAEATTPATPDEPAAGPAPEPAASIEAARAGSDASAWPPEVLAAIRASGSGQRPGAAAPGRAAEPVELEPPIELQPVGFDALAEEILAGGRAAPAAAAEAETAAPVDAEAAQAAPELAIETDIVADAALESEPVLEAEAVLEAEVVLDADTSIPTTVELADTATVVLAPEAAPPGAATETAVLELAERLEAAARRLRESGAAGIAAELPTADRFDTVLIGLLTGFLAAHRG